MRVYYGWIIVAAALLMRRPPEMPDQREQVAMAPDVATGGAADPGMTAGQALRSAQFWVLALTYFCRCVTHSGPIFHTVSYGWLYIASFGIGIGAALIALLFPPFPSRRAAALERQSPA